MSATAKDVDNSKPLPKQLLTLTNAHITDMAKKHGINSVSGEAKDQIRRMAYITMESIIEEAKLYAHARAGYPGIPNFDRFNKKNVDRQVVPQGQEEKTPTIIIKPCDIAAVLRQRGIVPY